MIFLKDELFETSYYFANKRHFNLFANKEASVGGIPPTDAFQAEKLYTIQ